MFIFALVRGGKREREREEKKVSLNFIALLPFHMCVDKIHTASLSVQVESVESEIKFANMFFFSCGRLCVLVRMRIEDNWSKV
jgi:hypothetical protein